MAKRALPLTALIRTLSHQQKICIAERRKVEVVNDSPRKRGMIIKEEEDTKQSSDNNDNDY